MKTMIHRAAILTACLLAGLAPQAWALEGAAFLAMPVSPSISSLGNVGALAQGTDALYSNPAGMAFSDAMALNVSRAQMPLGMALNGLAASAGNRSFKIGLSAVVLTQPKIEAFDDQGNPAGAVAPMDTAFGLSAAGRIMGTHLGATIKYITLSLAGEKAQAPALDFGVQRRGGPFQLGFSVTNLGPKLKFVSEPFDLPLSLQAGIGYSLNGMFHLQTGIMQRPYSLNRTTLGLGAEMSLPGNFQLRTGLSNSFGGLQTNSESGSSLAKLNFGLGWKWSRFKFDYALSPGSQDLGFVHRTGLQVSFGGGQAGSTTRSTKDTGYDSDRAALDFLQL